MVESDALCNRTMRRQHGVISLDQARASGLSQRAVERRVQSGKWNRLLPRVYAVAGAPPSWEQCLVAAVLWGGAGSAVSHVAAAVLWELPGFRRAHIEITSPRRRKAPARVVVHHRALRPEEVTARRAVAVTTPSRTLVDLSGRTTPSVLDAAFHHCVRTRLVTAAEMERAVAAHAGRGAPGAPLLRKTLAAYGNGGAAPASVLETKVLRLLQRSSLPAPRRQHEVRLRDGSRRYLDFAWPSIKLGLEADSYQWHSSHSAWARDRKRLRDLTDLGWEIVPVTHADLSRPGELLRVLERAHHRRSTA